MPCSHGRHPGGFGAVNSLLPILQGFRGAARCPSPPSRFPRSQTPCFFMLDSVEADGLQPSAPFQLSLWLLSTEVALVFPAYTLPPPWADCSQEKNKGIFFPPLE